MTDSKSANIVHIYYNVNNVTFKFIVKQAFIVRTLLSQALYPDDEYLFHYKLEGDIIDIVIYVDDISAFRVCQQPSPGVIASESRYRPFWP